MNKQNLFVISNGRNRLSLDKSFNKPKSTDNLQVRSQQSCQFKKNKESQCSPSKKNNTPFPQDSKLKHSNHERNYAKTNNKFPMKLRIVSRPDNEQKSRSTQHNTPKKVGFDPEIRAIFEGNLINELLQNDLAYKTRVNQLIIKPEVFTSVIEKIILACFNSNQGESNEDQLDCLTHLLRKVRHMVTLMMAETRQRNFSLCKNFEVTNVNNKYFHDIRVVETELNHLHSEKLDLIQELKGLNSQKQAIALYNQQQKQQIEQKSKQLIEILKKTQELKQEQIYLRRQVQKLQGAFSKCEQEYDKIINYVASQTKNKHVQQASITYKNIQSEIYEYAVYLQANELASSETYESIPFKNQCFVINNLEKSMKEVNKEIAHNEELTVSQKESLMRNFVLQVTEQYRKKDEECQKLLEFKTKCIRKFVGMMKLWLDNWTLKQEYLMNLRKQFAIDNSALLDEMDQFFHQKICTQCYSATRPNYHSIIDHYRSIQENYKMGNSFY